MMNWTAPIFRKASNTALGVRSHLVFIVMPLVLGAIAWGLWAFRPARWRPPVAVYLVRPAAEAGEGLSASQKLGFHQVLADRLTYLGDLILLPPGSAGSGTSTTITYEIEVIPKRSGDRLSLTLRWREVGKSGMDHLIESPLLPPRECLPWVESRLPFRISPDRQDVLLPQANGLIWDFLDLMHSETIPNPSPRSLEHARDLTGQEPKCASGWRIRGRLAHLQLLAQSNRDIQVQHEADLCFQRAMGLAPNHPAVVGSFARYRGDLGDHEGALASLAPAMREHTRNVGL